MKNINESEKNRIRGLHNINLISEQSPIIDGPDADTSDLVERLDKLEKKVAGMDSLLKNHFLKVHPEVNKKIKYLGSKK